MCQTVFIPCDKEHESTAGLPFPLVLAGAAVVVLAQAVRWLAVKTAVGVRWAAPRVWRVSVRLVRWLRARRAQQVQRVRIEQRATQSAIESDAGLLWSEVSAKKPANA